LNAACTAGHKISVPFRIINQFNTKTGIALRTQ
jgi:hypothetical protein